MIKEKVLLYIDDIRLPNNFNNFNTIFVVRTYKEAIDFINNKAQYYQVYISFDHDLGEEKSGYDVAKYLVENQIAIKGFKVHSANPVGRMNIEQLLTHYGYSKLIF